MKRTFIAVPVPSSESFNNEIDHLKRALFQEKIRWVKPFQMHITLAFLGDTTEENARAVANALPKYLENCDAFLSDFTGLGVFPKPSRPRVLWVGAGDGENWMELKLSVDRMLKDLNLSYDQKKFHPHLTLGRIKFIRNLNLLKSLLQKYERHTFQSVSIKEVHYYESILKPEGAAYNLIKKVKMVED